MPETVVTVVTKPPPAPSPIAGIPVYVWDSTIPGWLFIGLTAPDGTIGIDSTAYPPPITVLINPVGDPNWNPAYETKQVILSARASVPLGPP